MDNQVILKRAEKSVLTLILNRPQAHNAFNVELALALRTALEEASRDDQTRIVVLHGAGKAFSAGGDIKLFHQQLEAEDSGFRQVFTLLNEAVRQIRNMAKPVVAAVQGPAYAAGFGVALACDLLVASHSSTFSPSFINIALAPNASSTFFLPRILGIRRATEAFLRAQVYSASEALELGIVNHVWSEEAFEDELKNLLDDLAGRPAGAVASIKQLMNASLENSCEDQIEFEKEKIVLASRSDDFRERVKAFAEKRRPKSSPA